jgi:hypothetical protein
LLLQQQTLMHVCLFVCCSVVAASGWNGAIALLHVPGRLAGACTACGTGMHAVCLQQLLAWSSSVCRVLVILAVIIWLLVANMT